MTFKLREDSDKSDITNTLLKLIQLDESLDLKVPDRLTNPDKLVIAVKDDIYKSKVWKKDDSIVRSSYGQLKITVSPKNIGRALIFLDTLIKAIKQRDGDVIIEYDKTLVVFEGEKIPICIREKHSRTIIKEQYYDRSITQSTGLMSLKIDKSYSSKEWSDGNRTLEEQLPTILVWLEMYGKQLKEEKIEIEKYWEEKREIARKEKEYQDRIEKELNEFKELFRKAKRHDDAEKLRKYATEMEQVALHKILFSNELKEKIEWIRKKADWYDPFIEAEDELLKYIDRDDLKFVKNDYSWILKE